MDDYFTFRRCLEYIDDIKDRMLFDSKKGGELPLTLPEKSRKNKAFVAVSKTEQAIILPVGEHYHVLRFANDNFFGKKGIRTLKRYKKDEFKVSCYQLSVPEFLDWFDESQFFAEEVFISGKEAEILKKHQIKLPSSGKTTRRHLKEAYLAAIKPEAKEKPKEVNQIVDKYIKKGDGGAESAMALELEKAFHAKDEDVEISKGDDAIFTKYGIHVTQRTSYKDIKSALDQVNTKKTFTMKTISQEDLEVFKKYGIAFSPTGEALGRVKPPKERIAKWKIALCFLLIAAGAWVIWGDKIMFFVDDFVYKQKNKLEVNRILRNLEENHLTLHSKADATSNLIRLFEKEYPLEEKRGTIPLAIQKKIKQAKRDEESLEKLISHGKALVKQKKFAQALTELGKEAESKKYSENAAAMDKLYAQLNDFVARQIGDDAQGFRDYCLSFQKTTQKAEALREQFTKEYPIAEEDYLQPHPRVLEYVAYARAQANALEKVSAEGKSLIKEQKFPKAFHWLEIQRQNPKEKERQRKAIDRVYRKLLELQRLNQRLKEEFSITANVQRSMANMRNYILRGGEWLDTLDEKLALLEDRYPYAHKRIPLDEKITVEMASQRKKIGQLEKVVSQVDEITGLGAVSGYTDRKKIQELVQPYFSLDLSELDVFQELDDTLDKTLEALEKLDKKDVLGNFENMLSIVKRRRAGLENSLQIARRKLEDARQIPANFNLPVSSRLKTVLDNASQELRTLEKDIATAQRLLEDREMKKLKDLLEPLSSEDSETSQSEVDEAVRELAGLLQTAKAFEIEQTRQVREFSLLQVSAQKQLARLEREYGKLQKNAKFLANNYPQRDGYPFKDSKYKANIKKAKSIKKDLGKALARAKESWENKDLSTAYRTLKQKESAIAEAKNLVKTLAKLRKKVKKRLIASKKEQKRKKELARIERTLDKLDRYNKRLQQILKPIEQNARRLVKEFPASKGYPQLSVVSQKTLKKAQKQLKSYRKVAKKVHSLLKDKNNTEALKRLSPYEGKNLSGKSFFADLAKLQEELQDKLHKAQIYRKTKSKGAKADKYFSEIRARRDEMAKIVPGLEKNLERLKGNLVNVGLDTSIYDYLKEGKMELRDLNSLIAEAEQLMKTLRYKDVVKLLGPYSAAKNPDITQVKLLRTFYRKSQEALQIAADPAKQREIAARKRAREQREKRIEQLSRPPGDWYRKLGNIMSRYEKIGKRLSNSLEDQGSRIRHSRIEVQLIKAREYPETIAELDYIIDDIESKNHTPQEATFNSAYREKIYRNYLSKKEISIDVLQELQALDKSIKQLEDQLQTGGWIEKEKDESDDPLRVFLFNLQQIDRKYKENYRDIQAPLLNIQATLPN